MGWSHSPTAPCMGGKAAIHPLHTASGGSGVGCELGGFSPISSIPSSQVQHRKVIIIPIFRQGGNTDQAEGGLICLTPSLCVITQAQPPGASREERVPANSYHLPSISRLLFLPSIFPEVPVCWDNSAPTSNHEREVSGPRAGATHLVASEQLGQAGPQGSRANPPSSHFRSRCRGSHEPLLDMKLSSTGSRTSYHVWHHNTIPQSPIKGLRVAGRARQTGSESFPLPGLLSPVTQESVSTDEQHLSTVYNNLAESLAHAPSRKHWTDQVGPGESRLSVTSKRHSGAK